jgi:hypothetical protein
MRLTRRLFLALLGAVAMAAVGGFWWQLPGLSGHAGLVPAAANLEALRRAPGVGFLDAPTLAWLSSSEVMLHALCAAGVLSALALVLHLAPRLALLGLWGSWLSLSQVCHPWLSFQWDALLVEAAFTAIFFAPPGLRPKVSTEPEPSPTARFLLVFLACKVTLESGLVKLRSGDPSWQDWTALTYHWWTQPLPTWISAWMNELPLAAQLTLCGLLLVLEVPVPLLALGPRPARLIAAGGLLALQLAFSLTGNFAYAPWLTATLAVPLLDDGALRWLGGRWLRVPASSGPGRSRWFEVVAAVAIVWLSLARFAPRLAGSVPGWLEAVVERVRPFRTINGYGAFAVMTKTRQELSFEGTLDGHTWLSYELPFKPGRLDRRPAFVAPYHPRLDWQLWFAALGTCADSDWLPSLERHLLLGTPAVLALFDGDPFAGRRPAAVRIRRADYRFAPWSQRGVWWAAVPLGPFCPAVRLDSTGALVLLEP